MGSATRLMKTCLRTSVELSVNVLADSFRWVAYTETVSYFEGATVYEYNVRSTISVCESHEGQALTALEALIQNETYDEVLSRCLGRDVTGVSGSFTSTSTSTSTPATLPISNAISVFALMESTDRPSGTPTRQPTADRPSGPTTIDLRQPTTNGPSIQRGVRVIADEADNGKNYCDTAKSYLMKIAALFTALHQ